MSAPNASPFDLTPPVRPGTDHFNGIAKIDDAAYPPNPQTQPNADEWNTIEWLLLSIGRVMPVAVFTVTNSGTPILTKVQTAAKDKSPGDFTVTDVATGRVRIEWAAGTFPSSAGGLIPGLNGGPGMIHAVEITNGLEVFTYNSAGAAADFPFTVILN